MLLWAEQPRGSALTTYSGREQASSKDADYHFLLLWRAARFTGRHEIGPLSERNRDRRCGQG